MNNTESVIAALQRLYGWKLLGWPIWVLGLMLMIGTHTKDATLDTVTTLIWMAVLPVLIWAPANRKEE